MKKMLGVVASIFMLLAIIGGFKLTANAQTSKGFEYELLEDGTIEIIEYKGSEEHVTIPSTINGKTVTSIGDEAFKDNEDLREITLPKTINHIGMDAFTGTPFYVDKNNWENNALYIDDYLIRVKAKTTGDFVIKEGTKNIAAGAFMECEKITAVTIPDSATNINEALFYGCTSLKKVKFPKNIKTIPIGTFLECSGLTSIAIPETVTDIEELAFNSCTGLTSITIPKNVKSIRMIAFGACTSLKEISIPNTVTSIEEMAFMGCTSLKTITIPDGVKVVNDYLLYGCTSLTSVTLPKSITSIREDVFAECNKLTRINYNGTTTQWNKIKIDNTNTVLSKITIQCSDGKVSKLKAASIKAITTTDKSVKVTWSKISGATQYQVQIATDSKFTKNKKTYTIKDTSKIIKKLKANQKYYVRVRSCKGNNYSDWSKVKTATTKLTGTTFNKFSKTKKSISMTWKKVSGVTGYQVQIATDSKFTKNTKAIKTKKTSATITNLKSKKKYYVRIRTYKGKKYSDWSKINSITIK